MKDAKEFSVILVTAPDMKVARQLASGALRAKLAACASLLPKIESHYWWQGKITSSAEVLMIFKTAARKISALEKFILANHPYDTPEFVSLSLAGGTDRYLAWITASLK